MLSDVQVKVKVEILCFKCLCGHFSWYQFNKCSLILLPSILIALVKSSIVNIIKEQARPIANKISMPKMSSILTVTPCSPILWESLIFCHVSHFVELGKVSTDFLDE